ncbi:unnamed protein product [Polarella glacialis]|uniref:Uncharacterized protein n=1 Tax=Polarella glacialis TaxID=89957 RepID=A0A813E8S3_POLGL|nr:unnamed protein product [Polarella glacialis]
MPCSHAALALALAILNWQVTDCDGLSKQVDFAKYPGYTGNLSVMGSLQFSPEGSDASQILSYEITGGDSSCGTANVTGIANACGIHIHVGTNCSDASTIGDNFWSKTLYSTDPWQSVMYAIENGKASATGVTIATGLTNQEVADRVVIIHDATGARISCSQMYFFKQQNDRTSYDGYADSIEETALAAAEMQESLQFRFFISPSTFVLLPNAGVYLCSSVLFRRQRARDWGAQKTGGLQRQRQAWSGLSQSEKIDKAKLHFKEANLQFDERFNDRYYRLVASLQRQVRQVRQGGAGGGSASEIWKLSAARLQLLQLQRSCLRFCGLAEKREPPKEKNGKTTSGAAEKEATSAAPTPTQLHSGPWMDTAAMTLIGAGVGSSLQGLQGPAFFLGLWGLLRAGRRFVVLCVDTEDTNRLFRFAPQRIKNQRGELFVLLANEVHAIRRMRAGDLKYLTKPRSEAWHRAMDESNDYTAETLFEDTMVSIAEHPRVHEWVGTSVRVKAAPDKVVSRIHEGIAEVFLGWEVEGSLGTAEVQVKATGSIVDVIYVFPQGRDHYGLRPGGFVIRPKGNTWSQDCGELPKDMKQPFGKQTGRILRNREGIFEYDYEVRAFRDAKQQKAAGRS